MQDGEVARARDELRGDDVNVGLLHIVGAGPKTTREKWSAY